MRREARCRKEECGHRQLHLDLPYLDLVITPPPHIAIVEQYQNPFYVRVPPIHLPSRNDVPVSPPAIPHPSLAWHPLHGIPVAIVAIRVITSISHRG